MDITEFASLGGKARAKSMTARQRSEQARNAVETRWAKARKRAAAEKRKANAAAKKRKAA